MRLLCVIICWAMLSPVLAQNKPFHVIERNLSEPGERLNTQYSYKVLLDSTGKIVQDDISKRNLGHLKVIDSLQARINWDRETNKWRIDSLTEDYMVFSRVIVLHHEPELDQPYPRSQNPPEEIIKQSLTFWRRCADDDPDCELPEASPWHPNKHFVPDSSNQDKAIDIEDLVPPNDPK